MDERVILVDENDREIGSAGKMEAHREGRLHRAFSIFIFDSEGKLLLQKRAKRKYHSGGLWSNTCCSHPRAGFSLVAEAGRKLKDEMGFECELRKLFSFLYEAKLNNGYSEYEFDHVFVGNFDGNPSPNPDEVEDWKWADLNGLTEDLKKNPDLYTYWLRICIDSVIGGTT